LPRPNRLSQEGQTICIPRGNRVVGRLAVQRTGIDAEVQLQLEGLPAGVSVPPTSVSRDRYWVPVVFSANDDAPIAGSLSSVTATTHAAEQRISGGFQQVVDLVAGSADALFHSVTVDRLAVAVIEQAPFSIELKQPQAALAQDGTIGLRVEVSRNEDFDGAIDVSLPLLPNWVDAPAKITIPSGESSALYPLRAHGQAESRTWEICAEAKPGTSAPRSTAAEPGAGATSYRRARRSRTSSAVDVAVSSQLVTLDVSRPPVSGHFAAAAGEPGKTILLTCELERRGDLPSQLTATLEGLPNRVTASAVTVGSDEQKAVFRIAIDPTAPVGTFTGLVCRLSGQLRGQEVSYYVGRGGELKIQPPGALVLDETGRALTPLEALRRAQQQESEKE
jgi:hypothetical protein